MRTNVFGVRRVLRTMTFPAATAYVVITILTLFATIAGAAFGLAAEIVERLAAAGNTALAAAIAAEADLSPATPFTRSATAGTRR